MSILTGCEQIFNILPKEEQEENINEFILRSVEGKTKGIPKYSVLMVGLPGSGKTSVRERCVPDSSENFVVIDADEILTHFFNNDIKCYAEVYKIYNIWINYCIENEYNFILEGTGRNHDEIINRLSNEGYFIILCVNLVNIKISKDRASRRGIITGRVVRPEYI
jgi:predicted ABC-type ATPase